MSVERTWNPRFTAIEYNSKRDGEKSFSFISTKKLDDEIVRRVTGGIPRKEQRPLDEVIEAIYGTSGSKEVDEEPK